MTLLRDLRYALRLLLRSPAYSLIVVAVLALGIGVNLIAFGLFQALALTPLSGVRASAELQFVVARTNDGRDVALPYPDYLFLRDRVRAYDALAGSFLQGWIIGRGADATRAFGEFITGNYFEVLGVGAQHGRVLTPADDRVRRGHPVVVLSDQLWRETFGADPSIVGRTIDLGNVPMTVVGVAAAGFHGAIPGVSSALFVPYAMQPELSGGDRLDDATTPWVFAFGRPRAGVTLTQARAEAANLARQLEAERPVAGYERRVSVVPIWQSPQGAQTYMLPAVSLMGVTTLVLLAVVCANVAGLVLVRSIARRGEIAARLAVGASRGAILRLLLVETLLLAIPGACAGYWLPPLLEPYLNEAQPSTVSLPLYFNIGGGPVILVTLALAVAAAVLAGLVPAMRASRLDLAAAMKDDLSAGGGARSRLRSALVVAQVAMALVLLVCTALVTRSLTAARLADPGFDAAPVASVLIDVIPAGYDEARARVFYDTLIERLRADPAVASASLMKNPLLMMMDFNRQEVTIDGHPPGPGEQTQFALNVVGPGHFDTLRIPLVAGRDFDRRDTPAAGRVAIVNETFARRYWGSPAAAVGKRLQTAWAEPSGWRTVIGVARDIKYTRLNEPPQPYVYLPHAQAFNATMFIHARGAGSAAVLTQVIHRHLRALDANLPILDSAPLADLTRLGVGVYDITARTLAIVGLAAIALTALGIYGLVAYTVKQSTREIGIRVAVGASRLHVLGRYLQRGLRLGLAGTAAGLALAFMATRLIGALLYGVSPTDIVSFAAAAMAVIAVVLGASLVPAWRATQIDPLTALRHQ